MTKTHPEFRADIHCHSSFSDGSMHPDELVAHAKEVGLQGLSITDHDTTASYPAVFKKAEELGIEMISGVEFSTMHNKKTVHVLGYAYRIENEEIQSLCRRHVDRRKERNRKILDLLEKRGMPIHLDLEGQPKGRPHIAQSLVEAGHVATFQEAFDRWIGNGKPCYTEGTPVSTQETIQVIQNAGGVAVLAHPQQLKNKSFVLELLQLNFDGMECHYGVLGTLPEYLKIAEEKHLIITGGSDFHGSVKPKIPLGCSWTPEETFRLLRNRFLS